MRRVEHLALALLLSACGNSATSPTPGAKSPGPTPSTTVPVTPDSQRLIRITRFDCVKAEEIEAGADFPWPKGIASWANGGPGGAAWNVPGLRCAVELQTDCSSGEANFEMRIGGSLVATQHAAIDHPGMHQLTVEVKEEQWQQHLDQSSPLTERFPYRTATFSANVTAACKAPEALGPSEGPRLEFADDRHFTAGFASGE